MGRRWPSNVLHWVELLRLPVFRGENSCKQRRTGAERKRLPRGNLLHFFPFTARPSTAGLGERLRQSRKSGESTGGPLTCWKPESQNQAGGTAGGGGRGGAVMRLHHKYVNISVQKQIRGYTGTFRDSSSAFWEFILGFGPQ